MEFMTKVKLAVFGIVALLAIIVFFQNNEPVETDILFFAPITMPQSVLLIFTLLFGFVMGMIASVFLRHRKSKPKDI